MKNHSRESKNRPFSFQTQKCTSPERHFSGKTRSQLLETIFWQLLKPVSQFLHPFTQNRTSWGLHKRVSAFPARLSFIIFIRFLRFFVFFDVWFGRVCQVSRPVCSKTPSKTAFFDHFGSIFGSGAGKTLLSILSLCSQIPLWELLKTRFYHFSSFWPFGDHFHSWWSSLKSFIL